MESWTPFGLLRNAETGVAPRGVGGGGHFK